MNFTLVFPKDSILETELYHLYKWILMTKPEMSVLSTHPRVKKQVDVLVEKSLILLISCTEILQELMSQFHDLLHSDILALMHKTQGQTSFLFISH